VKIGAEYGKNNEKRRFDAEKRLAKPCDGRIIAETTGKTQFDAMNNMSNGKSRLTLPLTIQASGAVMLPSGRKFEPSRKMIPER
jgi:hypothetical protein